MPFPGSAQHGGDGIGGVLAVVGATICGGSGMAMISAGPLGMIAGACAGMLIALIGKGGMEKMMRGAKLPVLMRMAVTDGAVRRGMGRQKESIRRSVITALSRPESGFAAGLTASIASTIGEQMESMAKMAEMAVEA